MSVKVVNALSGALARRTGRRGFLARSAVAGSAVAVAPRRYLLEPVSAYAALCNCNGSTCSSCAVACCDGYTEFCCTLNGSNTCPPGTLAAGWWKADAPGLCGSAPRYYIDCNVAPGNNPCSCGCANGNCGNRKACCTQFRYGQCHQEVPVVGAIMCRVVTCTPPWVLDPTCTTAVRTDNATRFHDAACLTTAAPPKGLQQGAWFLRDEPSGGSHDLQISYGARFDLPVVGDWDGSGTMTPGVFRDGAWYLRNAEGSGVADVSFSFGDRGDLPIVGRWVAGDRRHYPGVIRGTTWYLRTSHTSGAADIVITYGDPGDVAVVGDWNGDGQDGIGVFRAGGWHLRDTLSSGVAEQSFSYGGRGDVPVTGRWVAGDPTHYPGVVRGDAWYLRHSNSSGVADSSFGYGVPGDLPLVGDWDGDGQDGVGVAR